MSHRQILENLARSGLLEDCRIRPAVPAAGAQPVQPEKVDLTGRLVVEGHVFHLRVNLPRTFPLCLPAVFVEQIEPPLDLPHLFGDNQLCFAQEANLLDRKDPCAVVREALLLVRTMLGDMISGDRAQEFAQEIVAYWRRVARDHIDCSVEAGDRPHVTMALYMAGDLCAVADDPQVFGSDALLRQGGLLTNERAVYIPVNPASIDPGFQPRNLTTLPGLRRQIKALPEESRRILSKLLARRARNDELVVLGVQRPRGERALVGVHLHRQHGGHPLADERAEALVIPLDLRRWDHAFLAPRGGASPGLRHRRVLIAGCGAVGGHVALALARAGVGELLLVDPDVFEAANTYRHVCGMAYVDLPKVHGLSLEIARLIPGIRLSRHMGRAEALLAEQPSVLHKYDLVISAIGHPTVELALNERIWLDEKCPPAIFAWVEPFGLGGHVLLTHARGPRGLLHGCLECLYQRSTEGGPLENRAAFAQPGVIYTRDTLGCGSQHLPFADLDAQRTAETAVRLALRQLRSEIEESPLLSWKGDRRAFERAGYKVTPRYEAESSQLEAERLLYRRHDCPICGD